MDEDDSQDELINRSSRGKGKRAAAWAISDNSDEAGSNEEADSESGEDDEDEEQLEDDEDEDEEEEDEEEEEEDGEAKPEEEGACAGTAADLEVSSDEEAEKCPICLHSFSRQPVATPENCEHYFCLDCILEWSKNANSCPIDRTNFKVIYLRTCFGGKVQKMITIQKPAKQCEQETVDLTLEETSCEVCGGSDREDRLLLCDGCDAGYHMECLTPPLNAVPVEEWFCPECEANNRHSRGSAAETSDTDSLPSTARTASTRSRSHTVQTRAIARTQHSERVRANVNRHRITQARTQELAPTYLIRSTWLDETINAVVAGLNSAMYVRDLTSRPPTRRRKSRKAKGRKTSSKSKMGKTGVKRRKRRVRRTKSRKKLVTRKTPTPRTRIANSLGIVKDKKSSSLPTVYRPSESTLSSMRADIGAASLSIYGDPFDLDPFTDREDDEQQAHNSLLLEAKRRGISRSAFRSHQPVARPVNLSRRPVSIPQPSTVAEAAPVPDLLGSILSGQSMLLMDSSDVIINRDGSLKTGKPMSFTNRMPDSRSRSSSSGDGPQVSPGPLLDHMDSLGSSDGSLDRHFSNNSSPLSPPFGSTFTPCDMSHSVVAPRGNPSLLGPFSHDPNRPNQRVGRQLTNGVSESRQNSPSTHLSSESSKSKASTQSLKAPTKPMWMDVSVLPRIPKIKKESSSDAVCTKTGSNANKTNGSSSGSSSAHSHGLPDSVINRLAGDKERGHSVEQQHGRTAGPRNRPDGEGSSSGFSSSFSSSSSAASHTNHQRFSSGSSSSSSSVSFRINSSGNSWHSRRLNIASQTPSGSSLQEDFSEEEKKRQLHRDKQKLLASRSKDSNSIYDPFNPTESDSGSSDGESGGINVECSSRLKQEPVKLKNKVFSKSRWDLKQVKVETQSSHSQDKPVTTTTQETLTHQQKGTKVNTPFRKFRFSHIESPSPFNTVIKKEPESDEDEEVMHALDSDTEDTTQTVQQSLGLIKTELTVKEEPTPEPSAAPCDGNTLATSTASPVRESTSSPVRKSTSSSTKKSTSSPARKSSSSPVAKSTSSPVRKSSSSPTRKVASSTTRKSASSPSRKSASSPSRKSASSPFRKSASIPARKSTSSPGRKSASSPGRKSASSPSRKSASSPSRKSSSSPIRKSSSSPIRKSSSSPTRKSSSSPTRKSSSSPTRKSASSPTRKSASSPTRKLASSPTRKLASGPSRKLASGPSRKLASDPSRKLASSPSRKLASSPSRKLASSPSRKLASSPSRKLASSPSRKLASSPSRKSVSSPTRKSASSPSRKSASSPSRKSASSPSRKSASSPSRKSASSPTRKSVSSPTRKSASSPTRKSASSPTRKSASSPTRKSASSPTRKSASSPSRKSASSPSRKSASSPSRKSASSPSRKSASSPSRKSASSPSRKSASSPSRKSISSPVRKTESHKNQSKDLGSEKHTCKKNSSSKDLRARSSSTERARKPSSPDRDRGHGHTDSKHGASQKEKDKARSSRRSRSKERRTHRDSDSSQSKSPDRTSKKRRRSRSQSKDRRRRSRSHSSSSSRERSRTKKHKKQSRERNEDKDVKRRSSKNKRRDGSRSRSLSQSRSRSRERRRARSRSKSSSRSRSRSRDRGKTESCRQTSRDEAESRSKDKKRHRSRSNSKEKKKERSLTKTQKTSDNSSSSVKDKDKSSKDKKKDDSSLIKAERASITKKVGSTSSMSSSTVKKEPMELKIEEKPIEVAVKNDNPKTNVRKEKWTALDIFGESPTSSPIMKEELDIPITDGEIKCKEDTQIKMEECEAEKLGVTSPEMKPSVSDSPISSILSTTVSSPPQYTAEQSTEGPMAFIKQEPLPQSSDSDDDFNVDVMLDNLALAKSRLEEPTEATVKDEKSDGEAATVGAKSKAQVKRVTWNIEEPVGPQPEKSASKVALYKLKLKQEGIRRPSAHSTATQDLTGTASVGDVTNIDPERSLGSESSHTLSASSQGQTDDGDFLKKDKTYLKKLHMQERAIEEVKLAIKPFYQKRDINKDEYKDILRKAVQKVCHSKSGEINPVKVGNLVKAYVDKYKHARKFKKGDEPGQSQEHLKLSDSP